MKYKNRQKKYSKIPAYQELGKDGKNGREKSKISMNR